MKNLTSSKRFFCVIMALMLTLSIFSATTAFAAEVSVTDSEATTYATKVVYPSSGSTSGYSTTSVTLTYSSLNAQVYRLDYAYWTEGGKHSNGKVTFRHNTTGETAVATFLNAPDGSNTFISLPRSGNYTVTIEKYNSGSTTFYYGFNLVESW